MPDEDILTRWERWATKGTNDDAGDYRIVPRAEMALFVALAKEARSLTPFLAPQDIVGNERFERFGHALGKLHASD
jgi:hypothetical protein